MWADSEVIPVTHYMVCDENLYGKISADYGDAGGVYYLRSLDGDRYRPVQRLLGPDPDGILYIGCSKQVCVRLGTLRKAICAAAGAQGYVDPGVHPAGRYYALEATRKLFPFETLCVTLGAPLDTDHYQAEEDALLKYEQRFGEAPPFNKR